MPLNSNYLKLCYVTDRRHNSHQWLHEKVSLAIQAGITMLQLREKNAPYEEILLLAQHFKTLLAPHAIPLIINDYIEIAQQANADGVHIGQTDISAKIARKILGPHAIIGLTIENMAQLIQANDEMAADYLGIQIEDSLNKTDSNGLGLEEFQKMAAFSHLSIIAIGNRNASNVTETIEAGAQGIACISAIQNALNTKNATKKLREIIDIAFAEDN